MKLHEIVDTQFRDTPVDVDVDDDSNSNNDLIGAGYYSRVHQPRDNPHEVHKTTKARFKYDTGATVPIDDSVDPYYDWVKAIAPYAKSNPYLPRVYVADSKSLRRTGELKPHYQLEKLFDHKAISSSVLYVLYYKEMANHDKADAYIETMEKQIDNNLISPEHAMSDLWLQIIKCIKYNVRKDPQIQQALDIVTQLIVDRGYADDMHSGNFMIRLTSIGPQIVITDPLLTL